MSSVCNPTCLRLSGSCASTSGLPTLVIYLQHPSGLVVVVVVGGSHSSSSRNGRSSGNGGRSSSSSGRSSSSSGTERKSGHHNKEYLPIHLEVKKSLAIIFCQFAGKQLHTNTVNSLDHLLPLPQLQPALSLPLLLRLLPLLPLPLLPVDYKYK